VEPASDRADQLAEPAFYAEMDVLVSEAKREPLFLDLPQDRSQALGNRSRVFQGNDPLPGQHRHVRQRSEDIVAGQPLVER